MYDQLRSQLSQLRWHSVESEIMIQGDSDLSILRNFKSTLMTLKEEFQSEGSFNTDRKAEFAKRLHLLEDEVEGLMKRRIEMTVNADGETEEVRTMNYANFLNEKENQIIELEKRCQNL